MNLRHLSSGLKDSFLQAACRANQFGTLTLLLADDRIDPNYPKGGPLITTCYAKHFQILALLLTDSRIDVNVSSELDMTALGICCESGQLPLVRMLLTHQQLDVNQLYSDGVDTPVMKSCVHNHLEIIDLLLADPRVNVNLRNKDGITPLMFCCSNGLLESATLLLSHSNIDVNATHEKTGGMALHFASQQGHLPLVELLLTDPKVDVNRVDGLMTTPFRAACANGHVLTVKAMLADHRVDVNKGNSFNSTPLWTAANMGLLGVVESLLASGRDIDTTVKSCFQTAYQIAIINRNCVQKADQETPELFHQRQSCGAAIAALILAYEKDRGLRERIATLAPTRKLAPPRPSKSGGGISNQMLVISAFLVVGAFVFVRFWRN